MLPVPTKTRSGPCCNKPEIFLVFLGFKLRLLVPHSLYGFQEMQEVRLTQSPHWITYLKSALKFFGKKSQVFGVRNEGVMSRERDER